VVLDPQPPRGGLRQAGARERLERLQPEQGAGAAANDRAISVMIADRDVAGLAVAALTARADIRPAGVEATVRRLVARGLTDEIGGWLFAPSVRPRTASALAALVHAFHEEHPLSEGIPREEARERLLPHAPPALFDRIVADLVAAGLVSGRERLAAAGRQIALSGAEQHARDALDGTLQDAGLKPPDTSALPQVLGLDPALVDRMLPLMARQRMIVKLGELYFHATALERLKAEVRAVKARQHDATLDVAAFKNRYGVSRKYAIPLLEYLDRERVTRRSGDSRVIV
jgi:selenocysteine-specific elongation factor